MISFLPIRVSAIALDSASLGTTHGGDRVHTRWAWLPPDYSGNAPGAVLPHSAMWPSLFNRAPGALASSDAIGTPPPLADASPKQRRRALCVSWSLPPAWTRPAVAESTADGKSSDVDWSTLPRIPDRWLVARSSRRAGDVTSAPTTRFFVVDAGVYNPDGGGAPVVLSSAKVQRVGQVRTLEQAATKGIDEAREPLTAQGAAGSRDFTFSMFVPANLDNLCFIDPLDDVDLDTSVLSYAVIGWYRDPKHDPMGSVGGWSTADKLARLGLTAADRALQQSRDQEHQVLAESAERLSAAPLPPADAAPAAPVEVKKDESLPARAADPGSTTLMHGALLYVDAFNPNSYRGPVLGVPGTDQVTRAPVGFGETSEEALVNLLAAISPDESASAQRASGAAALLRALLTDHAWAMDAPGGTELGPRGARAARFLARPGGHRWIIVSGQARERKKSDDPEPLRDLTSTHLKDLRALNEKEDSYNQDCWRRDWLAETWYATWRAQLGEPSLAPPHPRIVALEAARAELTRDLEKLDLALQKSAKTLKLKRDALRGSLDKETDGAFALREEAEPAFAIAKEPAVALRGLSARVPSAIPSAPFRDAVSCEAPPKALRVPDLSKLLSEEVSDAVSALLKEARNAEDRALALVNHHTVLDDGAPPLLVWQRRALGVHRDVLGAAVDIAADAPGVHPAKGHATGSVNKHVPLGDVGTVWTRQPWQPLFLDWEVEWFPAAGAGHSRILRGRTILANQPQNIIRNRLASLMERGVPGDRLRQALWEHHHALEAAVRADALVQSLGGLHQQLLGRDDNLPRPMPANGVAPWLSELLEQTHLAPPDRTSEPVGLIRDGSLELRRLWVVDRFGQALALENPALYVPQEALTSTPQSGRRHRLRLATRSLDPCRLRVALPRSDRPVRGWVLPSLLDRCLVLYNHDGLLVGLIRRVEDAVVLTRLNADVALDEALTALVRQLTDPGSGMDLDALLRHLDEALGRTPARGGKGLGAASLVGRPLALTRVQLSVERQGPATLDPRLLREPTRLAKAESRRQGGSGWTGPREVKVQLGSRYAPGDGLLAAFLPESPGQLMATAKTLGRGQGPTISLAMPEADSAPARTLDLLLDPWGKLHIDADTLPFVSWSLPPEAYEGTLATLPAVLRVAPLIVASPDALRPPGDGGSGLELPLPARGQTLRIGSTDAVPACFVMGDLRLDARGTAPLDVLPGGEVLAAEGFLVL